MHSLALKFKKQIPSAEYLLKNIEGSKIGCISTFENHILNYCGIVRERKGGEHGWRIYYLLLPSSYYYYYYYYNLVL